MDYRDAIGWDLEVYDEGPPRLCSRSVLHASPTLLDAIFYGRLPCAVFEVDGDPVVGDTTKAGFTRLHVVREITGPELDDLAGFRLQEAMAPVHPFRLGTVTPTDADLDLLRQWASVWASVGASVWDSVRDSVRASVWGSVWASVWGSVWASVWASVVDSVWASVGASVGDSVWDSVWDSAWDSMWAYIGSLFPGITDWRGVDHEPGVYPFAPAVDLWRRGLVPSFDGRVWRLHTGPDGRVAWEGTL